MKFKKKEQNDLLEGRTKGLFIALLGYCFTLTAIAIIYFTVFGLDGRRIRWFFGIPLGLFFILVGQTFLYLRTRICINKKNGEIEISNGLMIPLGKKIYKSEEFTSVHIKTVISRPSKGSPTTMFRVRLIGKNTVAIEQNDDIIKSRHTAKTVAKYLNLPLHDASFDTLKIYEPDDIFKSVRYRVCKSGKETGSPVCPKNPKSSVRYDGNTLFVNIPGRPFSRSKITVTCIFGFITGIFVFFLIETLVNFVKSGHDWEALVAGSGFIITFIFLIVAFSALTLNPIFAIFRSFSIEVRKDSITILEKGLLWRYKIFMPTDEIEELCAGTKINRPYGANGVMILSEKKMLSFAEHLPNDECEYLAAIITKKLVS